MELSNLNPISFAETDAETVKTEIIKKYEEASGRTLAQGDPIRLFLLTIADVIIHQRELIDFTGKMNLLAYAEGDYLDHLGGAAGCGEDSITARISYAEVYPIHYGKRGYGHPEGHESYRRR